MVLLRSIPIGPHKSRSFDLNCPWILHNEIEKKEGGRGGERRRIIHRKNNRERDGEEKGIGEEKDMRDYSLSK